MIVREQATERREHVPFSAAAPKRHEPTQSTGARALVQAERETTQTWSTLWLL
jgi:hypothetical protein